MGRYLSWLLNGALFVLCCFLVASTANAVFAALLTPTPEELAPSVPTTALERRSWQERQVILARNLFNASLLVPAGPVAPVTESLEATKLPLTLLGTYASSEPRDSWAAVEDKQARQHLVLQIDDAVQDGKALVIRIERRRIVLSENGTLRELALSEDFVPSAPTRPRAKKSSSARRRTAASRRRPAARKPKPQAGTSPVRDPAQLLTGGRPLPKYVDGQMVGFTLSDVQPGSIYEEAGLRDGDVITQVNGVELNDPQQSARLVMEFAESEQVSITVERADGSTETLNVPIP
jgi:general secretion pathway protein C